MSIPGKPSSFWLEETPKEKFPSLKKDLTVDVAIIGGGIVGIVSAYLLSQRELKAAVLESGRLLHGVTGHTTAKLTSQHGLIYKYLIDNFGREKAGPAGEKPICTHMGCVVSWNSAEKSWDCPCHGSRFDHEGKVIHAPAIKDLEKIKS